MKKILFLFVAISGCFRIAAQQQKDTINTEVINVVTSYTPTISDAFKAKDNPKIDFKKNQKKKLTYQISSTTIKSAFEPSAGSYKRAKTPKREKYYPNYLKIGYGNFGTPLLESFLYRRKKEHEINLSVFNKVSNGGIEGIQLNDNYLNTKVGIAYKNTQRKYSWETKINYDRDVYNWYGLPSISFDQGVIDNITEKQTYNNFVLSGIVNWKKGNFKRIAASINYFSDKLDSKESRIILTPRIEFPLKKNKIIADVNLDILNGEFKNDFNTTTAKNYGSLIFGTSAYYPIQKENFFFSIGAKIKYVSDLENKSNDVEFYPDVRVDYVLLDELMNLYGGVNGDLQQNSYRKLSEANPYVSPTLNIAPTDIAYNFYVGLKGKLSSRIHYNTKISTSKEDNTALFRLNQNLSDGTTNITNGYEAGNSFQVVYDNLKIVHLFGEITANLSTNLDIGANASIRNYKTSNQAEAWNLPSVTGSAFGNYRFGKWTGGATLFFVSSRKDLAINSLGTETNVNLASYTDLNFDISYQFHSKWNAFLELNNVLNNNYQRFSNFNVQGFQILAGAVYKFDL